MTAQRIGILHPGQMGTVVAVSAKNSGNEVYWASEGRSATTRKRAEQAGLSDAGTLGRLCGMCPVIVSVCPPEFAEEIAEQVARHSYPGTFVDANAISPDRTQRIARRLEGCGARFVDGGIIGPPALTRNQTWLYLAGEHAAGIAPCFSSGPIEAEVLAGGIGSASALKMCFAAYSKGSIALLCSVLAAAKEMDVLEDLVRQWTRNGPAFPEVAREISRAAPKAWRFVREMEEIAHTLEVAGMPPDFHLAAAEVFNRLAGFKGGGEPAFEEALAALIVHAPHGRLPT
jgi:3-hydroxyisobutyrate dehydrogenase-like beta-hydroxyacid dehydrogenase